MLKMNHTPSSFMKICDISNVALYKILDGKPVRRLTAAKVAVATKKQVKSSEIKQV